MEYLVHLLVGQVHLLFEFFKSPFIPPVHSLAKRSEDCISLGIFSASVENSLCHPAYWVELPDRLVLAVLAGKQRVVKDRAAQVAPKRLMPSSGGAELHERVKCLGRPGHKHADNRYPGNHPGEPGVLELHQKLGQPRAFLVADQPPVQPPGYLPAAPSPGCPGELAGLLGQLVNLQPAVNEFPGVFVALEHRAILVDRRKVVEYPVELCPGVLVISSGQCLAGGRGNAQLPFVVPQHLARLLGCVSGVFPLAFHGRPALFLKLIILGFCHKLCRGDYVPLGTYLHEKVPAEYGAHHLGRSPLLDAELLDAGKPGGGQIKKRQGVAAGVIHGRYEKPGYEYDREAVKHVRGAAQGVEYCGSQGR